MWCGYGMRECSVSPTVLTGEELAVCIDSDTLAGWKCQGKLWGRIDMSESLTAVWEFTHRQTQELTALDDKLSKKGWALSQRRVVVILSEPDFHCWQKELLKIHLFSIFLSNRQIVPSPYISSQGSLSSAGALHKPKNFLAMTASQQLPALELAHYQTLTLYALFSLPWLGKA